MNILHMKYAVEVARIGSINKAAHALFISQPHLGNIIRISPVIGDGVFIHIHMEHNIKL